MNDLPEDIVDEACEASASAQVDAPSVGSALTLAHAPALTTELRRLIDLERDVELHLAEVTEVDGAGIQVLLAAAHAARAKGVALHLRRPSLVVRHVIETLELGATCPTFAAALQDVGEEVP